MISELNARFRLKHARFVTLHGLTALHVQHPAVSGTVYLHGAHVAAWKPVGQTTDVLWMSAMSHFAEGKPIRGGVPICFPWFGPKADDRSAPGHGTVRLRAWDVESATEDGEGVTVELVTRSTPADEAGFPAPFEIRHRITLAKTLRMTLVVKNIGSAEARYEEALHTYLAVADVRNVTIRGLEGAEYLDKVDGGKRKRQAGEITLTAETDRPYFNTTDAVTVTDPGRGRKIVIEKTGSHATVVWNPWIAKARAMPDFGDDEWPGMLCVETCNVGENAIVLKPGEARSMSAILHAQAL